jgi:hypothetical protein
MLSPWGVEEMKTADLNDKRLDVRLRALLEQLGEHPMASIPAACGRYKETTAAYRFFDNERVELDDVLQPYIDATRQRITAQPVVLLPQDTTEIDVTRPQQQVVDAGPLDAGARRGAQLHLMHAFTPDGTPLGTLRATPGGPQRRGGDQRRADPRPACRHADRGEGERAVAGGDAPGA